ncbi:hypothetical protein [Chitinophaga tropicalis]|uniref:Uncharacterized protein n=1 Tax=Chitinophaga tropicalis TaxID=2683588 RepID=A0A7K1TYC4_9BACT|nr:hypothetical protein [Chitinophaga tropicalis]MVT07114.1 hypothetical protein [Chitinophaga tropicalis]
MKWGEGIAQKIAFAFGEGNFLNGGFLGLWPAEKLIAYCQIFEPGREAVFEDCLRPAKKDGYTFLLKYWE